jgi:hypothetical protein
MCVVWRKDNKRFCFKEIALGIGTEILFDYQREIKKIVVDSPAEGNAQIEKK